MWDLRSRGRLLTQQRSSDSFWVNGGVGAWEVSKKGGVAGA